MALMNCPECGKEISDQANACPNCGYPLHSEASTAKTISTVPKLSKKAKIILGVSLLAVALIVSSFVLFFNHRKNFTSLTHRNKGYSIYLRMNKKDVDKILDEEYNFYDLTKDVLDEEIDLDDFSSYDDDIHVSYKNNRVESISTTNRQLETNRGIHVGSTVEDVFSAYGENEIIDTSTLGMTTPNGEPIDLGYVLYYDLDWKGDVCDILNDKYNVNFYLDEYGKYVETIDISLSPF